MSVFKKILFLVFVLSFIASSDLLSCGGSDGQGGDDFLAAMMGNKKALAGLGIQPIQQPEISGDTLDIDDIDPITLKELNEQYREDLKNDMYWSGIYSNVWRFIGNTAETGRIIAKGTVISAAIITAVLAANPEIIAGLGGAFANAEALSSGAQLAWGVGFSGASTAGKSAAEMVLFNKSFKSAAADVAKAMAQSAAIGAAMPDNPVVGNSLDALLGEVDTSSSAPAHFDGLKDYGPGSVTTPTGQKMMK